MKQEEALRISKYVFQIKRFNGRNGMQSQEALAMCTRESIQDETEKRNTEGRSRQPNNQLTGVPEL